MNERYWFALGDDFHVTKGVISQIPLPNTKQIESISQMLENSAQRLAEAMQANVSFKLNAGKRVGNFNLAKCRHLTDTSDRILAQLLGHPELCDEMDLLYSQMVKTDFDAGEGEM